MRRFRTTLAVAALAISGCGDDSEDPAAQRTATATTPARTEAKAGPLTAAQYRARANRLCREDQRAAKKLGEPNTAEQIEPFLRRGLAYSKKRDPLYKALDPPGRSGS